MPVNETAEGHEVKTRTKMVSGLASAGLVATLFAAPQVAGAGHANPVLAADLDGRQEVATGASDRRIVGDPNGRGEIYVFGIDGDPARQTLCYVMVADKISGLDNPPGAPFAAHIHAGPRGQNGPVVVNLAWPQNGTASDCFSVGDTRGGNPVFPTDVTPADIFEDPEGFYINVHNAEYPAGAIRGQLETVGHSD